MNISNLESSQYLDLQLPSNAEDCYDLTFTASITITMQA